MIVSVIKEYGITDNTDLVRKILKHKIGKSAKPFIIAEAGINHNGKIQIVLS